MRARVLVMVTALMIPLTTACTPPVPPEVQAFRDELNVPCGSGEITVARPDLYLDFVDNLVANFNAACPDVIVTVVEENEVADVVISTSETSPCDVKIDTPLAYDATAVVFSQSSISELALSPQTLSKLLNGELSGWNDQRIVSDNPDVELPADEITITTNAIPENVQALNNWGKQLEPSTWANVEVQDSSATWNADDALMVLSEDNVIGIVPFSFAANNSLNVVALKDSHFDLPTFADVDTVTAGASQMKLVSESNFILKTVWDSEKKVTPPVGADTPDQPWGAVYPVRGLMCATSSNPETAQSFLRYGVRADEQQSLISYSLALIPEDVRLKLAAKLNQGLRIPTDVPIPE